MFTNILKAKVREPMERLGPGLWDELPLQGFLEQRRPPVDGFPPPSPGPSTDQTEQ